MGYRINHLCRILSLQLLLKLFCILMILLSFCFLQQPVLHWQQSDLKFQLHKFLALNIGGVSSLFMNKILSSAECRSFSQKCGQKLSLKLWIDFSNTCLCSCQEPYKTSGPHLAFWKQFESLNFKICCHQTTYSLRCPNLVQICPLGGTKLHNGHLHESLCGKIWVFNLQVCFSCYLLEKEFSWDKDWVLICIISSAVDW